MHHAGEKPPPITVFVEELDGPGIVEIYRKEEPQQDVWLLVERTVPKGTVESTFMITIETAIRNEQNGDLSLDDIQVKLALQKKFNVI